MPRNRKNNCIFNRDMTLLLKAEWFNNLHSVFVAGKSSLFSEGSRHHLFHGGGFTHVISMLSRQHAQYLPDLVIRLAAPAQQRKKIVFLVDNMQRQVLIEKAVDFAQSRLIEHDRLHCRKQ